jgi:hypothetical protein
MIGREVGSKKSVYVLNMESGRISLTKPALSASCAVTGLSASRISAALRIPNCSGRVWVTIPSGESEALINGI